MTTIKILLPREKSLGFESFPENSLIAFLALTMSSPISQWKIFGTHWKLKINKNFIPRNNTYVDLKLHHIRGLDLTFFHVKAGGRNVNDEHVLSVSQENVIKWDQRGEETRIGNSLQKVKTKVGKIKWFLMSWRSCWSCWRCCDCCWWVAKNS